MWYTYSPTRPSHWLLWLTIPNLDNELEMKRKKQQSLGHTVLDLAEELKHLKLDFAIFHIYHGTYSVFFTSSLALTTSSTAV